MACAIEIDGKLPRVFGLTKREVKKIAGSFAAKSSSRVGIAFREVTIVLQGDEESAEVHEAVNGVSGATDVITQPYDPMPGFEDGVYGELYVNVDRALQAAPKRAGWSPAKELLLYIAHGMDHLSGADDLSEKGYGVMRRRELGWIKQFLISGMLFFGGFLFAGETGYSGGYAESVVQCVFPQGGGDMRHLAGGAVRIGYRLNDSRAIEIEAGALENKCSLAMRGVWSMQAWEWFGKLFGYERLDPFLSVGARTWVADGDVGPCAGFGALYYLDDFWAVRFDGDVTIGLESECEAIVSCSFGLQYTF